MVCSTRQEVLLECACSPVVRTPAQWNAVCSRFDCVQKWEGVLVTVFTMADAAACARADSQHVGTGAVHVAWCTCLSLHIKQACVLLSCMDVRRRRRVTAAMMGCVLVSGLG